LTTPGQKLGAFGESYARAHLARIGYQVIESNVRVKAGEVDILAQEGGDLVFIEVRTRRGSRFGLPVESIRPRKAERMARVAGEYLASHPDSPASWRIDVVAVEVARDGAVSRITVLKRAVADPSQDRPGKPWRP